MPIRIYLMTDYDSSSLWTDEPEHGMVPLDGLPLDAETKRALQEWSPSLDDTPRRADHREEGLRLWQSVREQLAPDYEVGMATFRKSGPYSAVKSVIWHPDDLSPDVAIG
jgi:hypothetical protein